MKRERMEHNVGDVWVERWYTPDGAKRPMGARGADVCDAGEV